jgi:MoxR-like ATPase
VEDLRRDLHAACGKVVLGQSAVVDSLLIALAVGGHVLLEGVPGVAKTLLTRAFARTTGLEFGRIQFTPDMLPSDVTGTMTLRGGSLDFRRGPIFAGAVLADEINRTPPKTQSALLEAMQEGAVTVDGTPHPLPDPFIVIATQNPIEYEGTYPLPEAQLDRFLMKIDVGYPSEPDEIALLGLERLGVRDVAVEDLPAIIDGSRIRSLRADVAATTVTADVARYVALIVRATRSLPAVELGASPRAGVHLVAAAKAAARLDGRDFVTPDDVTDLAPDVLRHRIILRPEAELDRYRPVDAIATAIATVPVPR